jgi:hypothetical protein
LRSALGVEERGRQKLIQEGGSKLVDSSEHGGGPGMYVQADSLRERWVGCREGQGRGKNQGIGAKRVKRTKRG